MTDQNQEPPKKLYVWVVSQDGEHRIRKWDTQHFNEATHECGSLEYLYQDLRSAHAAKEAAWKEREKVLEGLLEEMILNFYIPEANCSCHKSPPCNDCVEYSYVREIKEQVKAALQNKGE